MAYVANQLRMISQGAGIVPSTTSTPGVVNNVYHYVTADTLATVEAANYFNGAASTFQIGDLINVSAGIGGTPTLGEYIVATNTGTTVGITGMGGGVPLTDSTGGAASDTLAAITAGASYAQADMVAAKNAISSLAAKVNALLGGTNVA